MEVVLHDGPICFGLEGHPAGQDIENSRAQMKSAALMNNPGAGVFIYIYAPEGIAQRKSPFGGRNELPAREQKVKLDATKEFLPTEIRLRRLFHQSMIIHNLDHLIHTQSGSSD